MECLQLSQGFFPDLTGRLQRAEFEGLIGDPEEC